MTGVWIVLVFGAALCGGLEAAGGPGNSAAQAFPGRRKLALEMRPHSAVYETAEEKRAAVVLQDGEPLDQWQKCKGVARQPLSDCFIAGEFVDRAEFDLAFGLPVDKDALSISVSTLNDKDKTLHPVIEALHIDQADQAGTFAVVYNCSRLRNAEESSLATIHLQLDLKQIDGGLIDLYWIKMCPGNPSTSSIFEIGHLVSGFSDVMSAVPSTSSTTKYIAHLTDKKSSVYVTVVKTEVGPQAFGKPNLKSSNVDVQPSIRGYPDGGILRHGKRLVLDIDYNCESEDYAEANITLSIPIPPFDSLSTSWLKKCGHRVVPQNLTIGSDDYDSTNVLDVRGIFNSSFSVDTVPVQDLYTLPTDRFHQEFYMVNHDSRPAMVEDILVKAENATVVVPRVREPTIFDFDTNLLKKSNSFFYIHQGAGDTIAPSEKRRFRLEFPCRAAGISRIEVEVLFRQAPARIAFAKECRAPEARKGQFAWTVQSATTLFLSIALLAIGLGRSAAQWRDQKRVAFGIRDPLAGPFTYP